MAYNKNDIDRQAEAEAQALSKVGRRERSRRLRFETGSFSSTEFDRLFTIDQHHKNK